MLSRVAASLYWLGRYMERAEFTARLVEATVRLDHMSARPAGTGFPADAVLEVRLDGEDAVEKTRLRLDGGGPIVDGGQRAGAALHRRHAARHGDGGRPRHPAPPAA